MKHNIEYFSRLKLYHCNAIAKGRYPDFDLFCLRRFYNQRNTFPFDEEAMSDRLRERSLASSVVTGF